MAIFVTQNFIDQLITLINCLCWLLRVCIGCLF
uniref:Uncharacterized protein n=1 Tax=Anguilla anguilla TaxID=7936 RepID=A0A0E9VXZ1_ANGAN